MSVLRVERDGAIARLTLNRPAAGNALDLELAAALRDSAEEISADDTCAVVLIEAEGRLFCTGGDVAAMSAAPSPSEYVSELAGTVHEALLSFARLRQDRRRRGVQGAAAGGGFGIWCSTAITSWRLRARPSSAPIPRSRSAPIAAPPTSCRGSRERPVPLSSSWSVAPRCEDSPAVGRRQCGRAGRPGRSEALRVAQKVAGMPAASAVHSKRLLAAAWLPGYREHLDQERESIARLAATDESSALRESFLAKGGGRLRSRPYSLNTFDH